MPHYKTFAQCVEQLMKDHQLTATILGAQTGSRTELRRALSNVLAVHGAPASATRYAVLVSFRLQNVCNCASRLR